MSIPVDWILTVFLSLAGVVGSLAALLWTTLKTRLDIQDKIIDGLRADIVRLSKGCGIENCLWRKR
jgi:hypothetical protein